MKYPPIQYSEYLEIDKLLSCQSPRSTKFGKTAHDELLFITVHQTYELWFKQILHELDSVVNSFSSSVVADNEIGLNVARLERVHQIINFSLGLIDLMETMTPLDFLDFRDYIYPASGFQSHQWRKIEIILGLSEKDRLQFGQMPFWKLLSEAQQKEIQDLMALPTLSDLVQSWLERTPYLQDSQFQFWTQYKKSVEVLMAQDLEVIQSNPRLSDDEKQRTKSQVELNIKLFESLFDQEKFKELQQQGFFKWSQKSLIAALFVQIYREEPVLQMPFRILQTLIDIDESLTQWRYRHSLMALRMIGRKLGTGGSSGHDYLKRATEQHRVFNDLFNLTSFLIPRSSVPPLPENLRSKMSFPNP